MRNPQNSIIDRAALHPFAQNQQRLIIPFLLRLGLRASGSGVQGFWGSGYMSLKINGADGIGLRRVNTSNRSRNPLQKILKPCTPIATKSTEPLPQATKTQTKPKNPQLYKPSSQTPSRTFATPPSPQLRQLEDRFKNVLCKMTPSKNPQRPLTT